MTPDTGPQVTGPQVHVAGVFFRYGCAVISVAVATVLLRLLQPVIGTSHIFVLFYASVFLAAWYGGLVPACVASALSGFAAAVIFPSLFAGFPPRGSRAIFLGLYGVVSMTGTILIVRERSRRRQAAASAALAPIHLPEDEREIQARERAEQHLSDTRSDLLTSQRIAHVGGWRSDLKTGEVVWTEETYRIFGVPVGTSGQQRRVLALCGAVRPGARRRCIDSSSGRQKALLD